MVAASTWLWDTTDALARRLREEQAASREEAAAVVCELEKVKARNREVGTQLAAHLADKEAAERRINDAEHLLQTTRESMLRLEQQEAVATVSVMHKDSQLSLLSQCVTLLEQQAQQLQKHQEDRDHCHQDALKAKELAFAAQDAASKMKVENGHLRRNLDELKAERDRTVEEVSQLRCKISELIAVRSTRSEHALIRRDLCEVEAVQDKCAKEVRQVRCNDSDVDTKRSKRPMEFRHARNLDCEAAGTRDQATRTSSAIVKIEGLQDDLTHDVATGGGSTLPDESSKDADHNQLCKISTHQPPVLLHQGETQPIVLSKPATEAVKQDVTGNKRPETMLFQIAEKQSFEGVELAGTAFAATARRETRVAPASTAAACEQALRRTPGEAGAECLDAFTLQGLQKGLPAQALSSTVASNSVANAHSAKAHVMSVQLAPPAPWKSTSEVPPTKSQQHAAERQNQCQECGHRKRTFLDANDNMHYCQECWVDFYGQLPGSSAVIAPAAVCLTKLVGQSVARPLPHASRKKRSPIFRSDLDTVGYTNGCRGCDAARAENPTPTSHTDACRKRIFSEMVRLKLPAAKRLREGGEVG
eukprot:TRINITY_DN41969_c0_g1_i1.p1 TRINITY_DN41969_c0_g1~~TRINITY_DN41969_c0_g1_i1.p1  ORF type:complete len:601 (-),score=125.49 TRINITY_DN41969_c0_g1_i1:156-1925(-)